MPLVGAVLGGDHDRPGGGPARVRVFIRGTHGKFLNAIGGEVLQEPANPVVGVVGAVHREFVVQARASPSGDGGDARLGGIGRLDRFGSGHQVSDVGEAACRERKGFQVPAADDALANRTRRVNRLGRDRGRIRLHVDRLARVFRFERDRDIAHQADGDVDIGRGLGKTFGRHSHAIGARQQSLNAEFSAVICHCLAGDGRSL